MLTKHNTRELLASSCTQLTIQVINFPFYSHYEPGKPYFYGRAPTHKNLYFAVASKRKQLIFTESLYTVA